MPPLCCRFCAECVIQAAGVEDLGRPLREILLQIPKRATCPECRQKVNASITDFLLLLSETEILKWDWPVQCLVPQHHIGAVHAAD